MDNGLKCLLGLSTFGFAGLVSAQAAEPVLEEILVTGQEIGRLRLQQVNTAGSRLGLNAMETPASVDLISALDMAVKGDYGPNQAVTRSAGLATNANPGNGGSSVSARGFVGHNSTINTYDGTRLYVTAGTVTFPADTWTLDRVEVLRGAGSVINGVGAAGVTINYVPKTPRLGENSFDSLVSFGSFDTSRIAVGGNLQLAENWALRLDASQHDSNGHVDRADEERKVIAGSLLYQPSSTLNVRLSVDYADIDAPPHFGTPLINGRASDSLRKQNFNFRDGFARYEDIWTRLHTEWQISPTVVLRNDTYYLDAYRKWKNLEEFTFNPETGLVDRAFFLGITHDQQQFGSRTDLQFSSSPSNMENRLNVGVEFNLIDLDNGNNFRSGGFGVADSVPVFGFDPTQVPADIPIQPAFTTETTQQAVFVDDRLQITERLSLVLGLRYDRFDFDRVDLPAGSKFDADFEEFTWRAGVVYQPVPGLSLYAQTSTAADPVTSPVSISAANSSFDLSTGRQFEVGLKQQLFNGNAEYTLAWFDIEKDDLLTRAPGSLITEQIGQQSSDGVELTLRVSPLRNLSLELNGSLIDAQFDSFFSGGVSLRGNVPANVPEKTANLWVNWAPFERLQLGAGVRYVGSRQGDDQNTQTLPSYAVLDASASWSFSANTLITLRARNLNDERDYVISQYAPNQWIFGDPRSYEISLRYSL